MKGCRRWRTLVVLAAVLIGSSAWADGVFAPLNGGEPIDTGPVETAVCLRNDLGTLYLLYLKDGALLVRRSEGNGASFIPCDPQLEGHNLSNFRQLTLLGRVFEKPIAFFVADEDGSAGLFGLCVGRNGELVLAADGRLDDLSAGTIGGYSVLPETQDRLLIAYLKSGTLWLSRISAATEMWAVEQAGISGAGQAVTQFELFERYPPEGTAFVGYYLTAEGGDATSLHSFSVVDGQVMDQALVDTAATTGGQQVHGYVTIDDRFEVTWVNGQRVSAYTNANGFWQRTGAVTAPLEPFVCFGLTDGRKYSPALATFPQGGVYTGLADEGTFLSPVNRNPVLRAPGGLSSSKRSLFLMAYLVEAGGLKAVETRLYDFAAAAWQDLGFPVIAGAEILDAWFSGTAGGYYVAVLCQRDDGRHVVVFQVSSAAPVFEQVLDVSLAGAPGGEPEADSVAGELLEDGLLALTVGQTRVVVDVQATRVELAAGSVSYSPVASAVTDEDSRLFLIRTEQGAFLAIRSK